MRCPRRLPALLGVLALLVVASGCGGDSGAGSSPTAPATSPDEATTPTASAPAATQPPPDATQPGTAPVAPPATTEPAAGDEQAVRVPASFVVRDGGLRPRTITVPPFLAVELSVLSADGEGHRLVLRAQRPHSLSVGAGERAAVQIPGLRAGRYVVELDGRAAGALVAGGEVGP